MQAMLGKLSQNDEGIIFTIKMQFSEDANTLTAAMAVCGKCDVMFIWLSVLFEKLMTLIIFISDLVTRRIRLTC